MSPCSKTHRIDLSWLGLILLLVLVGRGSLLERHDWRRNSEGLIGLALLLFAPLLSVMQLLVPLFAETPFFLELGLGNNPLGLGHRSAAAADEQTRTNGHDKDEDTATDANSQHLPWIQREALPGRRSRHPNELHER